MNRLFSCIIPGRVGIKKNSTQRKFRYGRVITMPSDRFIAWADQAILHVNRAAGMSSPIACPLIAHYRFYFKNKQHEIDVSNGVEGPQDLLAKAGVIENDKQIIRIVAEKFFNEEPRTEIELFEYKEG